MTKHEKFPDEDPGDVHVRVGTPEDVHPMMSIAMACASENGFVSYNPEKLLQHIWPALHMDNGIVGIVGVPGGEVEATVLLRIGTPWYSDESVIEEKALFVRPQYRSAKGGRAAKLASFAKDASDKLGFPLTIGILSDQRTAGKVRLYTRTFGPPNGAYWLYNATTGAFSPT